MDKENAGDYIISEHVLYVFVRKELLWQQRDAKILDELREKEIDVLRDALEGIRADKNNITINKL